MYRRLFLGFVLSILVVSGCGKQSEEVPLTERTVFTEAQTQPSQEQVTQSQPEKATIEEKDWSGYFNGLNGAAVFYDENTNQYSIYNPKLAEERRSPCSTFKIISALAGMKYGVIPLEDQPRAWSGEVFWNEDWNRDINFSDAFQTSCIWYFREVIDELGPEVIQEELNSLKYGNCDSSDWEGRLNLNNNNRALTGFWVESSLKISPKEQTEVMKRIFGKDSAYAPEVLEKLKSAMKAVDLKQSGSSVYGKTGLGKVDGIVVDSWFTGFMDTSEGKIYFCVYLGRTDGMEVSSKIAKEIAIQIAADYEK